VPYDAAEARRLREAGEAPRVNHNNCSGKHTGMLALARHLAAPTVDYLDPEHPVQRRIRRALAEMSGLEEDEVGIGVDGCSAPNFALPLRSAAVAFARLADPADLDEVRRGACRQIFEAMAGRPALVAGPGTFDTRLMEAGGGRWIAKGGAEGFHAVGLHPGAVGPGSPALGLAVKIADGDAARRALTPVVLAVLGSLGVTWPEDSLLPREFGPRPVRNWRDREVGETRTVVHLRRA
ncbi:MAG: asparaginase, partial [Anaerolineales bacterium]